MNDLLTAAQMRAIEAAAIADGQVSGRELMERAGCGVVAAILDQWPALSQTPGALPRTPEFFGQDEGATRRAVVLCGPGNNGGDGFVVARLLRDRGWQVELYLYGASDRMPADARTNHDRWVASGGPVRPLADASGDFADRRVDLVIDAVFGTGLSRPLDPEVAQPLSDVHRWREHHKVRPPVVAVDMPSGLCSDSGRAMGAQGAADLTVTFHCAKTGHYLADGPYHCGRLRIVDIGLPARSRSADAGFVRLSVPGTGLLAKAAGHKYDHGHALVLSGGPGRTGAARLAARGALRVGAGLVTLGVPPAAQAEVAAQVTAIMLAPLTDAEGLEAMLEDDHITALCLGPGLGTGAAEAALVARALVHPRGGQKPRATVLDADALTLIARDAALFSALHDRCVLTPHGGEFARLFPDLARRLREEPKSGPAFSRIDATRAAAQRAGCVVLLKGADTVIAGPDGDCVVNAAHYDRAAPWLASAGSGDVLAGFITGLLARGIAPMQAAETAAWLHVDCARSFGPGLIAEDLADRLPQVMRDLGL